MTVSTQRMEKVQHQSHIDFIVQLQRLQIKELVVNEDPNLPSLLTEFSEVFAESKGLPPTRLHYQHKLMKDDDKIITPLMTPQEYDASTTRATREPHEELHTRTRSHEVTSAMSPLSQAALPVRGVTSCGHLAHKRLAHGWFAHGHLGLQALPLRESGSSRALCAYRLSIGSHR
ncbi:hypothetical protein BHM03_00024604 [Ensete ventricosum]|nr:hypothetical protein BHM03_00024604 [Ensete ventricosum]